MPLRAADIIEIALERTPCFGTCPVYIVTLRRDGRVCYEGQAWVPRIGVFQGRIRERTFDRLAELAISKGFFRLRSSYFRPVTDMASAITTVMTRDRRNSNLALDGVHRGPVQGRGPGVRRPRGNH